jgi:hypothetical protein
MTPDGFINHGLGDWGNPDQALARENVETAFLYADAFTLADFARVLGKREEEAAFLAFAEAVCRNYNEKLLVQGADGKWFYRNWEDQTNLTATQACEALPLYWNMVPADKLDDVVDCFKRTLEEKNAFASGEVGLPYIIQTASRFGMDELIAKLITRPEHPSYYAFVKDGMTTLGEYWETNPRSHCHDMMGHIIEWYYSGIAGIQRFLLIAPLDPSVILSVIGHLLTLSLGIGVAPPKSRLHKIIGFKAGIRRCRHIFLFGALFPLPLNGLIDLLQRTVSVIVPAFQNFVHVRQDMLDFSPGVYRLLVGPFDDIKPIAQFGHPMTDVTFFGRGQRPCTPTQHGSEFLFHRFGIFLFLQI